MNEKIDTEKIYRQFLRWYALPQEERTPPSFDGFAKLHEIETEQLLTFQDRETFADDLYKQVQKWAKEKSIDLVHLMYKRSIKEGKINDVRAFKELLELDKKDEKSGGTYNLNIFNPTDSQYEQILLRESKRYEQAKLKEPE